MKRSAWKNASRSWLWAGLSVGCLGLVGCPDTTEPPGPTPTELPTAPGESPTIEPSTPTPPVPTAVPPTPTTVPTTPTEPPPSPTLEPEDVDQDGVTEAGGDCDDTDPTRYPGATELAYDGVDQDCSGADLTDVDEDGYDGKEAGGTDCDDQDPAVFPGALEAPYDGVDQDCSGADLTDVDGDGYDGLAAGGDDCDDTSVHTYPGAPEFADGQDNDCDGRVDDGLDSTDDDGDGYSESTGDCDDSSTAVHPGASDTPYDGVDQDCSGQDLTDVDGDGYAAVKAGGSDCQDEDEAIHPEALEACDGVDNDCDGGVDEGVKTVFHLDSDGDGYGAAGETQEACAKPEGYVSDGTDCDDSLSQVSPGREEVCDGLDNDCDGSIDEGVQTVFYADSDQDGYGNAASSQLACQVPEGYVRDDTDCDDLEDSAHPGQAEACDEIDNNCDGVVDEGVQTTFYLDADQDGYGDASLTLEACTLPPGYAELSTDCDDAEALSNPGTAEVCDELDNDCDDMIDDGVLNTYYLDADGDGFGAAGSSTLACTAPKGYVSDATDCDDLETQSYPGLDEQCDGIDNNCDGVVDEGVKTAYFADADGDEFGDISVSVLACDPPEGHVIDATDCDDTTAEKYPGLTETCDGLDNNCDGDIDEGLLITYYLDDDQDGYGDAASTTQACSLPAGYASSGTDCDDTAASTFPGSTEVCDSIDNDCDGQVDDGLQFTVWYHDTDGDGSGDPADSLNTCSAPGAGWVTASGDNCPTSTNVNQADLDMDGVGDVCDNCPTVANPTQENSSSSSMGDACRVSTAGLVLYLDADHPASWTSRADPTSSNFTWNDLSGLGNNATVSTSTQYQAGSPGGFRYTRDAADRATATVPTLPQGSSPFSGEAWFALQPYSGNCASVLEWGTPATTNARAGLLICTPGSYNPYFVGQGNDYQAPSGLNTGTIYHVAFTYDGGTVRIYVNGVEAGSSAKTLNVNGKTVYVGVDNTRNTEPFNGTIHVARVYNRTLSASEVKANYDAEKGRFGVGKFSCDDWLMAGYTSDGNYYNQPPSKATPVGTYCDQTTQDGGWALLAVADGWSSYFGNASSSWNAHGWQLPPLKPGSADYHGRPYGLLPTDEVRLCYKDSSHCYIFKHNLFIPLQTFFTSGTYFVEYSVNTRGYSDKGTVSLMNSYLSSLGFTAHTTSCYWLGINDVKAISAIGLGGDWNGGCANSSGTFLYNDDLAIGVGIQSCYDANGCYNGGTGNMAGQSRGANGVDASGIFGPWHVYGR